jgi:hypothetical protein
VFWFVVLLSVMWYPFTDGQGDENLLFRFNVELKPPVKGPTKEEMENVEAGIAEQ